MAANSATYSKPAKHLRTPATARPVVPSKPPQKRRVSKWVSKLPNPQTLDGAPPAKKMSYNATEVAHDTMDEEKGASSRDSTPEEFALRSPRPEFSVSQAPRTSVKKLRTKTSHIHKHISTRGDSFICNSCSRAYKITGGTGAIARHLKKYHSIDPTASGLAEKRTRERTAIDTAILRKADISIKAEEKRREEMMGIGLDKNILEYLYLKWTRSQNIPLNNVRDKGFRTFLEYINPVANRMLPNSESTMKIHAETLLGDGNEKFADDDS